uniref:Conserved oligomeric Golgi complex subunit 8 n=1 Tax=Panagrolaimus sp. ES5 TaxID=591445 RepID=A0AC34F0D9_9BILA
MKSVSSYEITEKEVQEMFERKKENRQQYFSKKDNLSNVNTSTLSLHIAAYENSAEASAHANEFNEEKEDSKMSNGKSILAEKWKKAKQIIAGPLPVVQNPFEFPRQQRNQIREPEVMQFKASQRLLNPNESRAEDQQKRIWGSMDIYDEQLGEQASIEKDIQQLTLAEISSQRTGLSSRIGHLSNEISDLAFNNYRTYADAGRTAEHCKKMVSFVTYCCIKENMPELTSGIKTFAEKTKEFHKEYDNVATVNNRENLLWKILDMPKIMHQCIRSGEYEAAFALTDFAVSLKHSRLYQQPIIKKPVDFVIEARHGLLDELFNKFSGPIDLSRSIQVVNNIRKIPYISNTQLRVSILQYRDVFLDSQVTKSMSKEDYIYKIVDIYRDCMYDTMVLYLAVFPDTESHRRFVTTHDPRWERWTGSSQNYHLQAWAHKNLEHLFEYIRNCTASKINYEALREKLMSFASSFGRMGLDFRLLILEELRSVETKIFKEKVGIALHNLITKKVIHLVDSEIVEMARSGLIQNNAMEAASLPLDMIAWDDLVAYANEIITCLNDL